jgi:hypothetical protein
VNDIVNCTERVSHAYVDTRAVFGSLTPNYWHVIWMAVSCCCGLRGNAQMVRLPEPNPRIYH